MPHLAFDVDLPDGFAIRAATDADVESYVTVSVETLGRYARELFQLTDEAIGAGLRDEFSAVNSWVIHRGPDLAGLVVVMPRPAELWLDHMVITGRFQGRGIGTAVVRAVQEHAARLGLAVTLSVIDGNPARVLYERLGFTVERVEAPRTFYRWVSPQG